MIYMIDLFCGAGGTTTGATLAGIEVIACVNHDAKAIRSHAANHPRCIHFTEDIRTLKMEAIRKLVAQIRKTDSSAKFILWASLECTNFSKAKGGLPRDADSRTLANHLPRYVKAINPDFIYIENVTEFQAWGPLDHNGKPINKKNGTLFVEWTQHMCALGYKWERKELNAADFGAYTSRNRLFIQFVRPSDNFTWPVPTHSKKAVHDQFGELKKWKAVKHCLDFSDEGESIFTRKKPLSEKTLERIYAGLLKYVAGGKEAFLSKCYSGKPHLKNISIEGPSGTITCRGSHALVNAKFLALNYSGGGQLASVDSPSPTLSTKDRISIVGPVWLDKGFSGRHNHQSVEAPSGAIPTKDHYAVVDARWLDKTYTGSLNHQSVDSPAGTILTKDKHQLVQAFIMLNHSQGKQHDSVDKPCGSILTVPKQNLVTPQNWVMNTNFDNVGSSIEEPIGVITANRKWHYLLNANSSTSPAASVENPSPTITQRTHYLMNPQYLNNGGDIEKPCFTLIARMDKMPPYLVETDHAQAVILVYDTDSSIMVKIKEFMAMYGLCDIRMRMLRVKELLKIQGFPEGYHLEGTQADQKKFIGNSVEVNCCQALLAARVIKSDLKQKAT